MIKSMTSFASGETSVESLLISCELRSVNHRYCDITIKMPERIRFAEQEMRSIITAALNRGKIECAISYKKQSDTLAAIEIDESAVIALLKATASIEEHMHSQQPFSALDVLSFPGIQQEKEIDKDLLLKSLETLLAQVLEKFIQARETEGQQLAQLIEDRCNTAQELTARAEQKVPLVLEQLRSKLYKRISDLKLEPDFDRLEQELVFAAQKLDVAEELDRLQAHIKEVKKLLNSKQPIGRRLDFLMQEMNREANTLGSKSSDLEMTQISIDLKVLIEQMREQIQNIE
jgi:uncharacterized protein (TIGR00255 family)